MLNESFKEQLIDFHALKVEQVIFSSEGYIKGENFIGNKMIDSSCDQVQCDCSTSKFL